MEMLETGSYVEETAEKFGKKEAARRTRAGFPTEYLGLTPVAHVIDRTGYQMNPDGTTTDTFGQKEAILYHPVVTEA
jgi:hypothetical protein